MKHFYFLCLYSVTPTDVDTEQVQIVWKDQLEQITKDSIQNYQSVPKKETISANPPFQRNAHLLGR